jgi:pimeloyl-ACP methyl ester carboxylesterase
LIYDESDRENLRKDPLVRLLIPNPDGNYEFTIVTAMGVITEGKAGTELKAALDRLEKKRGVRHIRADTATVRSFEYNADRIIEAIEATREYKVPFGLVGYSQGCANALMAESLLYSGTPDQQEYVKSSLACRQLLFSAANGSLHGAASDKKVSKLVVMFEEFVKYQQGYFSRALQSLFLETITTSLDSAQFHKIMGGAQGFLFDGCRAFWREAQHLPKVPTCVLRGVLEPHTTPEALEMLVNMLTKQSGSNLHDSQVHVFDAVGHPVYHHNRNGRILEKCEVGSGAIQRFVY